MAVRAASVPPVPSDARPTGRRPLAYRLKRVLLGPPLATAQLTHERLSKLLALPVFSSDAISSTAYGTESIMLAVVAAGAGAIAIAFPISLGIAALLAVLILSYRQTIAAYPSAGGAYVVTKDNFGIGLAQVAGSALLIDYVLTVAVSVASGIAAVATVVHGLGQAEVVLLSVVCVLLIMWANLRGVQESGKLFAVPTYLYVGLTAAMLLVGLARLLTGHLQPIPPSQTGPLPPQTLTVGLLLVMHAFASGCTALTGVEAISNGVPAFRRPEAANARATLAAMGLILGSLFVGISFLAVQVHVRPYESGTPTLIGQLASWVLGRSVLGHTVFYAFQAATLLILVLAANTSFADFPRLASFAAGDAFMPRQFTKRGHRLVFSNGIITLSLAAIVLIVAYRANVAGLLPLYAIGVFTSFTLSQAGMTRRHLRLRGPGWRYGVVVNGTGALVTFLVLLDLIVTKFTAGAWVVLVAQPILVFLLYRTNRAYAHEVSQVKVEASETLAPPRPRHEVLVLVERLDRPTLTALQYARQLNPLVTTALHIAADPDAARRLAALWARVRIPVTLEVVACPDRDLLTTAEQAIRAFVRPNTELTVLVPRREYTRPWQRLLHDRTSLKLFKTLGRMDRVVLTIIPYRLRPRGRRLPRLTAPWAGTAPAAAAGRSTAEVPPAGALPPGEGSAAGDDTPGGEVDGARLQAGTHGDAAP